MKNRQKKEKKITLIMDRFVKAAMRFFHAKIHYKKNRKIIRLEEGGEVGESLVRKKCK